ncbi:LuxR family transcriptional regulator [Streptomyces subrutilus]|uniref:LuxR family transcriptional regulator n=3 Tax=Streptomyces subrutilus TaxID=36818 RepID=A0A5P2UF47_9ACTN|nr:LuxR family transcriptional regulator [Streptomyces subrutilus]
MYAQCMIMLEGQMGYNGCENEICRPGLCDTGLLRYQEAVTAGSVPAEPTVRCAVELGLLEPVPGDPERLAPVVPTVAASRAMAPIEEEIAAGRRNLQTLAQSFESADEVFRAARAGQLPSSSILRGGDLIARTIDAAVTACQSELLTAQPGGRRPPQILATVVRRNLELLDRGVAQRTLYQHAVWTHPPTAEYIRKVAEAGGNIRTVDEMFDRLIICDRKVAYIPTSSEYPDEALEVRDPVIVWFLANVFEYTWARGTPVDPGVSKRPEAVVSEIEQSIVRFLVAGHTEEKIARGLGISRRTVAEYISRISRRLGSASRAQLGYLIATHGLLGDQEPAGPGCPCGQGGFHTG